MKWPKQSCLGGVICLLTLSVTMWVADIGIRFFFFCKLFLGSVKEISHINNLFHKFKIKSSHLSQTGQALEWYTKGLVFLSLS